MAIGLFLPIVDDEAAGCPAGYRLAVREMARAKQVAICAWNPCNPRMSEFADNRMGYKRKLAEMMSQSDTETTFLGALFPPLPRAGHSLAARDG